MPRRPGRPRRARCCPKGWTRCSPVCTRRSAGRPRTRTRPAPNSTRTSTWKGRGLHLIPSLFCRAPGITLHAELPVLAFPVSHDTVWTPGTSTAPESQGGTLGALLGPTRAALLQAISAGHGITTSALARRTGISSATVSHHTTVLRDAGLITTHRTGTTAHHLSTPLGSRLLNGTPARDQQSLSTIEARRRKQAERQP
ncbi:ArsR/SmtB family transcription factor [Streptomyces sp. L7]